MDLLTVGLAVEEKDAETLMGKEMEHIDGKPWIGVPLHIMLREPRVEWITLAWPGISKKRRGLLSGHDVPFVARGHGT